MPNLIPRLGLFNLVKCPMRVRLQQPNRTAQTHQLSRRTLMQQVGPLNKLILNMGQMGILSNNLPQYLDQRAMLSKRASLFLDMVSQLDNRLRAMVKLGPQEIMGHNRVTLSKQPRTIRDTCIKGPQIQLTLLVQVLLTLHLPVSQFILNQLKLKLSPDMINRFNNQVLMEMFRLGT